MTDVSELVPAYKREVAGLGDFATAFPRATDTEIVGALMDAFGEAQLGGFFQTMTIDVDDATITPDLTAAGAALVVIYAGIRSLRNQIIAGGAEASYKAGPVEYATKQNSYAQTELLKQLERRRDGIVNAGKYGATPVYQMEGYAARGLADVGGFAAHELATGGW